jgi:hypothetical protein
MLKPRPCGPWEIENKNMTPTEHEILKLKIQLLAQKHLTEWLADLWRLRLAITPEPERTTTLTAMASKLQDGEKEYSDLTLPWLDAANSDMQAGLFQEAFDEISKAILNKVGSGLTRQEEVKFLAAAATGFPSVRR